MDKNISFTNYKQKLAIIGSGDLGQSIAHYAKNNGYNIIGFYDDFQLSNSVGDIPVLGRLDKIEPDFKNQVFDVLVCAVGYNHFDFREKVFNRYHHEIGIPFATIIDKSCHVDSTVAIGEGVVMFPTAMVDKGCVIEDNVLLNVGVTIAHDSIVKRHSFLSPRVAMAGFSTIGERCMIGINSTIIDNVTISNDIRVGGGTIIIKSLTESGLYVGVPARYVKK